MNRAFYDGYIFQNEGNGKSLAVIQIQANKCWVIEICYDVKNGSSHYVDNGIMGFPANIKDITASFSIKNATLEDLLIARHDIKRALGGSRQYASERIERMNELGDSPGIEPVAQMIIDRYLSDAEQAYANFDYECDRLFWEYLRSSV